MQNINISKLNTKKSIYSFSFPEEIDTITESIKRVGVIQPIILTHSLDIICGMRRVLSCKKLKVKKIPAIPLDKKLTDLEYFKLNLEENLSTRKLNIIEKSITLNLLKKNFNMPEEIIIKEYLPLLKIPANIKYLNNYIWINNLSHEIKKEIITKDISIEILNNIKNWPKKIMDNLFPFLLNFNFGNSKILQIITLLNEISLRDNKPIDSPLESSEWNKIKNKDQMPLYQKGIHLREILLAERYPMYTELKNKLKHVIAKLKLSKNTTITPDIFTFENNFIEFKIQCKQPEELKKSAQKLAEIADSKELQELLELLKI